MTEKQMKYFEDILKVVKAMRPDWYEAIFEAEKDDKEMCIDVAKAIAEQVIMRTDKPMSHEVTSIEFAEPMRKDSIEKLRCSKKKGLKSRRNSQQKQRRSILLSSLDKTRRKAKMMTINLKQESYISSGEHRLTLPDDHKSVDVLYVWYEAYGEDEKGNGYTVIWELRDGYDPDNNNGDESDACDWEHPAEILDDCGHYVDPRTVELAF